MREAHNPSRTKQAHAHFQREDLSQRCGAMRAPPPFA
ncbi:hypothetical protein ANO14919_093360 [Xylariales sp. No.14919]|nr:hypothetical protein ANO14919_093360 [Xylariales sp. No.14919]